MTASIPVNQHASERFFVGKRVVITGGAGYIGTAICKLLAAADCHSITRVSRTPHAAAGGAVPFRDELGDVREAALWRRALPGADIVFHLAGQTSNRVSDQDPLADQAANMLPMLLCLEECRRLGSRPRVIFAGTVTQTGLPLKLPVGEAHADAPITFYDLHKQLAEQYLKYYSRIGAVDGVSLRLPNIYGPGPKVGSADRGILNLMIERAVSGKTLTVYGAGTQLRDYLFIDDAGGAFLAAATQAAVLSGKHFVIGTGVGHSIAQAIALVANRVGALTGAVVPVVHVDPPEPLPMIENRSFVADIGGFTAATGWRPQVGLAEGIERTAQALLSRMEQPQ